MTDRYLDSPQAFMYIASVKRIEALQQHNTAPGRRLSGTLASRPFDRLGAAYGDRHMFIPWRPDGPGAPHNPELYVLDGASKRKLTMRRAARTSFARKRAAAVGARYEYVDYDEVLLRDGPICWICHLPITTGDRLCFDHWIPLSKGGSHTAENIHPAHYTCNARKSAKLIADCSCDR